MRKEIRFGKEIEITETKEEMKKEFSEIVKREDFVEKFNDYVDEECATEGISDAEREEAIKAVLAEEDSEEWIYTRALKDKFNCVEDGYFIALARVAMKIQFAAARKSDEKEDGINLIETETKSETENITEQEVVDTLQKQVERLTNCSKHKDYNYEVDLAVAIERLSNRVSQGMKDADLSETLKIAAENLNKYREEHNPYLLALSKVETSLRELSSKVKSGIIES